MKKYLLLFLSLFFSFTLYAQEYFSITYIHDINKTLTVKEIATSQTLMFSDQPLDKHTHFPPQSTIWLKVTNTQAQAPSKAYVLQFLDIRIDDLTLFDKNGIVLVQSGDRIPFNLRPIKDPRITLDLPSQSNCFYIKIQNEDKVDLIYLIKEKGTYLQDFITSTILHAFFFGAMFVMLVYNFMLLLFIRERSFLIYVLYHIALLVVMLYYNGLMIQYLQPDAYGLNAGNVPRYLFYITIILAIEFQRSFLSTFKHTPKLDILLKILIVISFTPLILQIFFTLHFIIVSLTLISFSMVVLAVSVYYTFVLKDTLALFYLLGWITMLVGLILTGLLSLGFIERTALSSNIFQIGTLIEVTLLSMGLAYRYKVNQDTLAKKTKIIQAQAKLASMGDMLRHISHQWRQPLAEINSVVMKIESDFNQDKLDQKQLDHNLENIETITSYMSKTIHDFNGFFEPNKLKTETRLVVLVNRALHLVKNTMNSHGITYTVQNDYDVALKLYTNELVQVLLVILNNAIDALSQNTMKEKHLDIKIFKNTESLVISIEDTAGGVSEDYLEKIFEPYFTTKFEAQGTGIGLYMAKVIIEESLQGKLSVSNTKRGARFVIAL